MTNQQRRFCIAYIRCRNASKSALEAGYSEIYSKSKAYELLKIKEIVAEVERLQSEYYTEAFKDLIPKAIGAIEEIIDNSENLNAKLRASELILKQTGTLDPSKVDQKFTIVVKLPEGLKK